MYIYPLPVSLFTVKVMSITNFDSSFAFFLIVNIGLSATSIGCKTALANNAYNVLSAKYK